MRKKNRACCMWFGLVIVGLLFAGCVTAQAFNPSKFNDTAIIVNIPGENTASSLPAERPPSETIPPEALETELLLKNTVIPSCDYRDITFRLADPGVPLPEVVNAKSPDYKIGDERQFWVSNADTNKYARVTAKLVEKTDHAYVWLENGAKTQMASLKKAVQQWENKYYPTDRAFFGNEWSPGVDNDVHVSWLISNKMGTYAAGYYSSMDEYSHLVNKYSNEMEMFYLNSENNPASDIYFDSVLAHEFAHMIEWHNNAGQANWIDEGLAELACQINGLDSGSKETQFATDPDLQLNSWSDLNNEKTIAHYGAAYIFMSYFLDRFGKTATQALVTSKSYSTVAVDEALKANGITFNQVFADWTIANYINDPKIGNGEYAYRTIQPGNFEPTNTFTTFDYPVKVIASVAQYGTDYIELYGKGELEVNFTGNSTIGLTSTVAHSGKYMWWGGSNNASDTMLTRTFDLSSVKTATLTFWTWYDIEKEYDYAFAEVSVDGKHWVTLKGLSTTANNPNGANYGFGFTGTTKNWIQEKIDLSRFAGKKIQVRFEYITDAGVTKTGFFLDDIEIPEIGYSSNVESDSGGWEAKGFVRNANILPQHWSVRFIAVGENSTSVEAVPVAQNGTGKWVVRLNDDKNNGEETHYVMVISGLTPVTLERARYALTVIAK